MARAPRRKTEPAADEPVLMKAMGWRPDMPDIRDHLFAAAPGIQRVLPPSASIAPSTQPPIQDQGNLGSCTGFMAAFLHEQLRRRIGLAPAEPSPLYTYWFTRYIEGGLAQTKQDTGATIRDAVRSLARYGQPEEQLWPYDPSKFTKRPPKAAETQGLTRQVVSYQRCRTLDDIKASVADGYPVGFGFMVYESAMSPRVSGNGRIPMPSNSEGLLGGHACSFVGYNDSQRVFRFRNQWGPGWGDRGYGYLPYEFVANPQLCLDWWTVRAVETP